MKPDEYTKSLNKLAALLKRKPLTAALIARSLGCCIPTAYSRVRSLITRGDAVYTVTVEENRSGPRAVSYGVR